MGSVSALLFPVIIFAVFSSGGDGTGSRLEALLVPVPVFVVVLIGLSNATSLITIISIYREGGILKRLRSTPLQPYTILTAHVLVKLVMTALSLSILVLLGKTFGSWNSNVNAFSFGVAIVFSFVSLMSIGFVIASFVPTARFAQPLATFIFMPLMILSPLFVPLEKFGDWWVGNLFYLSPFTHATNLLDGIWNGGGWGEQWVAVVGLIVIFVVSIFVSTKVFRWE
jgi:ABC-2 type transport system permease protein